MCGGFIKLHRKITEWEWFTEPNTFLVFVNLLFMANWKDGRFQGVEVPRGSLITSVSHLALRTKLSVQQTRTALANLQSTNEITIRTTNRFSFITVNNYGLYQDYTQQENKQNNKQDNKQITINQQTNNKQITTIEEYKNIRNKDINNISPSKNDGGECVQPLLLPSPVAENATTDKAKEENKASKAEQLQLEADFDFFWTIYPKKQGKKEALKAYIKARKKANRDELLEALREVKTKDWRNRELQYIPHASTWLNQERWTDEVTEAKKIDPLDDLDLEINPFEVNL